MAFRFSLAVVLKVRQSIEDRESHRLEAIQHEILCTLQQIQQWELQQAEEEAIRRQALSSSITAFALQTMEERRQHRWKQRDDLHQRLAELRMEREQQLAIYEAARRNRQVLTEMRNQQQRNYEIEATRRQQKILDDIFLARHKRD